MIKRSALVDRFVAHTEWRDAIQAPLAGDASNRRYLRLTRTDGQSAVLMDAPPDKGEDVRPFVEIARHLLNVGLSAPAIYAEDQDNGLLLIEDLGDALYARVLESAPEREQEFYSAAIDALCHLHQSPCPTGLLAYDAETTVPLAAVAYDWYLFGVHGACNAEAKAKFIDRFTPLITVFNDHLSVLIQRDYHAENLLWLPERSGIARVGLLDFQDAMRGHPAYDLVSILQDARRDVSAKTVAAMKARFIRNGSHDPVDFETAYAVFGLQRNLRILGVFARLCLRDNKAHYVDYIPRVWRFIETNLQHPSLADLRDQITNDLPSPQAQVLTRLKEQSGSCAGR